MVVFLVTVSAVNFANEISRENRKITISVRKLIIAKIFANYTAFCLSYNHLCLVSVIYAVMGYVVMSVNMAPLSSDHEMPFFRDHFLGPDWKM